MYSITIVLSGFSISTIFSWMFSRWDIEIFYFVFCLSIISEYSTKDTKRRGEGFHVIRKEVIITSRKMFSNFCGYSIVFLSNLVSSVILIFEKVNSCSSHVKSWIVRSISVCSKLLHNELMHVWIYSQGQRRVGLIFHICFIKKQPSLISKLDKERQPVIM